MSPAAPDCTRQVRAFVSYAREDEAYVRWVVSLATRLRRDGVDARLDYWHLKAGDTLQAFMSSEIRNADKVIVLCSPEYRRKVHLTEDGVTATGVGFEAGVLSSTIFVDYTVRQKLVAVLVRGGWEEAAPDVWRGQLYADLSTDQNFEKGYQELLSRILNSQTPAPPIGDVASFSVEVMPLCAGPPAAKPSPDPEAAVGEFCAPITAPNFVDREDLLRDLALSANRSCTLLVVGLAGIGKTAAVAKYATSVSSSSRVIWVSFADITEYRPVASKFAAVLAREGDGMLLDAVRRHAFPEPDVCVSRVLGLLRTKKVLIVLDDFESLLGERQTLIDPRVRAFFEGLLRADHSSVLLILSRIKPRDRQFVDSRVREHEVRGLDDSHIATLLGASSLAPFSEPSTLAAARALSGHPLATKLLAALAQIFPIDVLLRDERLFLDDLGEYLLIRLLNTLTAREGQWLGKLATPRGHFDVEMLEHLRVPLDVVRLLRGRFLVDIESSQKRMSVHPLVRRFVLSRLSREETRACHSAVGGYYASHLPTTESGIDLENLSFALEAAYHFARAGDLNRLVSLPFGFAEGLTYLGAIMFNRHRYREAAQCFEAVVLVDPHDDRAHFYLAASLDMQGTKLRSERASDIAGHYREALRTQPRNVQYLDYFGHFLSQTGDDQGALDAFAIAYGVGARCPTLYRRYAAVLRKVGQLKNADSVLDKGCRVAYNAGPLFADRAEVNLSLNRPVEACRILKEGSSKYPRDAEIISLLKRLT